MAEIEHPEKYNWCLNELESLGSENPRQVSIVGTSSSVRCILYLLCPLRPTDFLIVLQVI